MLIDRPKPHRSIFRDRAGVRLFFIATSTLLMGIQPVSASYFNRFENRRESPSAFRLIPELNLLSTSQNFGPNGAKSVATGLTSYSRTEFDLTGIYGINARWSVYARLAWIRNAIDHTSLAGTTYGLSDQELGLNFHAWQSKSRMSLDVQLQGTLPLYNNTTARALGNPLLGDGSNDITLGTFFTSPLNFSKSLRWAGVAGLGYTLRTAGHSGAIPWNFTLVVQPPEHGFFGKFALLGQQALVTESTTTITAPAYSTFDSGNSFITGPLNSSFASGRLTLGYQQSVLTSYFFAATKSFYGKSAPDVLTLTLGMQLRFADSTTRKSPYSQTAQKYGKSNKGFVNYSFEAKVTRANDRLNLIKIDKGSQDGVEVGQVFDIFSIAKDGVASEAVARAQCTNVQGNEAALSVKEYFREVWIEEGFVAKRPVQ